MGRQLTDKDIEIIVKILDGWTGKLTWDALLDTIEDCLHRRYTRQALDRHERIKRAYDIRKEALRHGEKEQDVVVSVEHRKTLERARRLAAENERLRAENNALLEQFARWAYNAHTRGLDLELLNKPLPEANRERTGPIDRQSGEKKA